MEFDATATDVSEIFISPTEAEQGPPAPTKPWCWIPLEEPEHWPPMSKTSPRTPTPLVAEEWSLLEDEPAADDESVIEESPLA